MYFGGALSGFFGGLSGHQGVFRSAFGSAAYFVMAPVGKPGPHDFETQSIRWASFEEAYALINLTTNPKGKARDLAVLKAARKWVEGNI